MEKLGKPLLKASEVASKLNISKALAYRLMQRGEIRCVRIGNAVRVRPEDLQAFVATNLSQAGSLDGVAELG